MRRITLLTSLAAVFVLGASSAAQADLSISNKATQNVSCNAGVCTATAKNAVLNVGELQGMLANGDATVKTGDLAKDITVGRPLTWTSTNGLTLDAKESILVTRPVSVAGTSMLHIVRHGDLLFREKGKIVFWDLESQLVINDQPYVLVNTVSGLSTAIAANPSGFFAFASGYDAAPDGTIYHAPVAELDGVLNGLGNTIANLTVTSGGRYSSTGLVRINRGIIRNLNLVDVSMSINQTKIAYAAGLAGVNYGTINHCSVSGTVQGIAWMGGLVAYNTGTVIASHVSANVYGRQYVGGLVAINGGEVSQSYATGDVLGNQWVGGLVGNNGASVTNIIDSYFSGSVGRGRTDGVGGLVGYADGDGVATSYSTGSVRGSVRGGVIGIDAAGTNSATYWDLDTSGISDPSKGCGTKDNCPGVIGLNDAELKSGLPDGFDPKIWGSDPNINNGYPYLIANPPQQ